MNTEGLGLNHEEKEIVKEFVIKKMIALLTDPECEQKIKEDQAILEKLNIKLAPRDIHPLIEAIQESDLLDKEYEQVRNGQRVESCFSMLADLLKGTDILSYYDKFSKVKLDRHNYSDFQFVNMALKILDYNNWADGVLDDKTKEETRKFYLNTTMTSSISGIDKLSNLNILQQDLNISLSKQEEALLIKHIKHNIMGSVDLIDQLKRTAFGVRELTSDESYSIEVGEETPPPKPEAASPPETGQEETGKKGLLGIFGKK